MRKILLLLLLALSAAGSLSAQTRTITGKVTDAMDGTPLAGVSVHVPNTTTGTVCNANGEFSLKVTTAVQVLELTFVGYLPRKVTLGNNDHLGVVLLSPSASELREVPITGYGSIAKSKYTGASTIVTNKEIANVPIGSFDQILQGKAAGLYITSGSGQPGANATVLIRGVGSIEGGTDPLYVLDGVPIETGVFRTLNPNDFEAISVLKDAPAKALYGGRGANGVIVITSKKGKAGKTHFTYNGQTGWSTHTQNKFDMLNSADKLQLEAGFKSGVGWAYSRKNPANASKPEATLKLYDAALDSLRNINTDWLSLVYRTGKFTSQQLSASGGTDKTQFYISGQYFYQQGIAIRSDLKRYALRTNIDHQSGRLKLGVHIAAGYSPSNFIESESGIALANPFAAAYLGEPYENPYDKQGKILTTYRLQQIYSGIPRPLYVISNRTGSNALARPDESSSLTNQLKTTANVNASFDILDGLSIKTNLGVDFRETEQTSSAFPNTYAGSNVKPGGQGFFSKGNVRNLQLISTSGFEYNRVIQKKHEILGNLLFETNRQRYTSFNYTGYGINGQLLNTPAGITPGNVDNGLIPVVGGGKTENGLNSYIAFGTYTYDSRYTLSGSYRVDGSSKVPEANRYHPFYSLGLKWNAKNESFLHTSDFLSTLQLRATYGTSANANGFISDFGYVASYGQVNYTDKQGQAPTSPGNANYDWEYAKEYNFGADFGLLNERISGTIDWYRRTTYNLFLAQKYSFTSGFSSQVVNTGNMRNSGVEMVLNVYIIRNPKKEISWSVGGNVSYNKNRITNLGQANEYPQGTAIVRVGLPYGAHYAVKWAGVDPQTGDAQYYTKDGKKTSVFSEDNNVAEFGTFIPPWVGGFNTSFSFKGATINALFSYARDFTLFNNQHYFLTNPNYVGSFNQEKKMLTYWQKPGDITDVPRTDVPRQFSSQDIENASYLRFRSLNISYALPSRLLQKTKILQGVSVYFAGENLYVWTKYTGLDPEIGDNLSRFQYPAQRTYSFGLNLTF
ncbi:TonB-linked SusC/RagA family outer membrane protein [Chitinophaga niastensis]|uniref:TonB-linked SusC/RagA family outer membrane protein n=1 Tax=Chitinophaga niastensis TaxID=536980 RepID=A0A2P8HNU5_CHINA|nr:SusC/RagA family TonB-linked outer membrane protein [Chitinophaga niastensis]PSL47892.1 TonB-linked SusC/RagA family outer membrane protein [Chitinophaga niastensis]